MSILFAAVPLIPTVWNTVTHPSSLFEPTTVSDSAGILKDDPHGWQEGWILKTHDHPGLFIYRYGYLYYIENMATYGLMGSPPIHDASFFPPNIIAGERANETNYYNYAIGPEAIYQQILTFIQGRIGKDHLIPPSVASALKDSVRRVWNGTLPLDDDANTYSTWLLDNNIVNKDEIGSIGAFASARLTIREGIRKPVEFLSKEAQDAIALAIKNALDLAAGAIKPIVPAVTHTLDDIFGELGKAITGTTSGKVIIGVGILIVIGLGAKTYRDIRG